MKTPNTKPSQIKHLIARLSFSEKCELLQFLAKDIQASRNGKSTADITIKDMAEVFFRHLEYERNITKDTIRNYRLMSKRFIAFCNSKSIQYLLDVDIPLVQDFIAHLKIRNEKPTTINVKLAGLKSLFRCAQLKGYIQHNPIANIRGLKTPYILPETYTVSDIMRLLEAPLKIPLSGGYTTMEQLRDRAILILLYATGMRANELAMLKIPDIDFENDLVRINFGKGSKQRIVPVSEKALGSIKEYLRETKAVSGFLFLSRQGERIDRSDVFRKVVKYAKIVGLPKLHTHTLRHCFATHLLKGGADIRTIQELLGHVNIATTGIYLHLDMKDLKKSYKESHPLDRKGEINGDRN